jgi:hypothetical protein
MSALQSIHNELRCAIVGVQKNVDRNRTTDTLEINSQDSSAHLVRSMRVSGSPGVPDHDVAMCRISDLARFPGRLIFPIALVVSDSESTMWRARQH